MKRLTLLTILLVVVGLTAGFALEVKPSFTLSGSGTVQWGVDLDTDWTGFYNSYTADLTVNLLAADGTDTHAGTGDWYGSITISNVELYATDGVWALIGDATVTAKIVGLGGALAIGVYPAPDLALDFVGAIENADVVDTVVDIEGDIGVDYGNYGTYVSYTLSEALMVGIEVVSENSWIVQGTDLFGNASQAYGFAFDVQAKFAPLTINAGVNYGMNYDDPGVVYNEVFGVGVKVAADTAMVDGWVGFDAAINGGFDWEVGAGVTFTVIEVVTAAFSVVYGDPQFNNLDIKFVLTEPAAKGLVDNLDASLTVYLLDVASATDDIEYEVLFSGGYLIGKLYPNFYVKYGDASNPVDLDPFLNVGVGVDYTLFDAAKTVLSLDWASRDLLATPAGMGTLVAGVTITY